MTTNTDTHGFTMPTPGDTDDWGTVLNSLIDDELEQKVPISGPVAERPAAGDTDLELYLATDADEQVLYYNTGSAWDAKANYRTDEQVEDIVASLVTGGAKVSTTYDDAGNTLTIDTSALDEEEVEDAVAAMVTGGTGLNVSYDDANDTLTINVDDPLTGVQVGTDATREPGYFSTLSADKLTNGGETVELLEDLPSNPPTDSVSFSIDTDVFDGFYLVLIMAGAAGSATLDLTLGSAADGDYQYITRNGATLSEQTGANQLPLFNSTGNAYYKADIDWDARDELCLDDGRGRGANSQERVIEGRIAQTLIGAETITIAGDAENRIQRALIAGYTR